MKKLLFIFICLLNLQFLSQEICDNGIDDDADGLVDLNDLADCSCNSNAPIPFNLPNSSFEDRTCCPTNSGQTSCLDHWVQPSTGTSDYYNTCGMTYFPLFGGSDAAPTPYPDGNGFMGFFNYGASKEYVGMCLPQPMLTGESFTLEFNLHKSAGADSVPMAIFGSTSCADLPFSGFGCPQAGSGFVALGTVLVDVSSGNWELGTINFTTSQDIHSIVFGPSCDEVPGTNYYHMDNLVLTKDTTISASLDTITISRAGNECEGPITLTATTTNTGGIYQWYENGIAITTPNGFGPTTNTYIINPLPATSTNYSVRYTNGSGCVISEPTAIITNPITYTTVVNNLCAGTLNGSISITNTSGGTAPYQYQIDANPAGNDSVFNNLTAGQYIITVYDNGTCSSKDTIDIVSSPTPLALFTSDTVCQGTPTTFTDGSSIASGAITTYSWDFGNTNTSTDQNPTFPFGNNEKTPITLMVTSDQGCSDTISDTAYTLIAPIANFSFTSGCASDSVAFTNSSTLDGVTYDNSFSFNWNFGDGNTSNIDNPKHLYSTNGNYMGQLTTSSGGCSNDTTFAITFAPAPNANFTFNASCEKDSISFINTSTINTGAITNYLWQFTPSDSNILEYPKFSYSDPNTYPVTLEVTSDNGCKDDTTIQVTISPKPIANYTFDPTCIGRSTLFYDGSSISSGVIQTFNWNFNGIGTSTNEDPSFTFTTPGLKNVQLMVTSDQGCIDSIAKQINVNGGPTASFSSVSNCPGMPIMFTNLSNINGIPYDNTFSFNWQFGGTDSSILDNSTTSYPDGGTYPVTLSATTNDGCSHDTTIIVTVYEKPIADFNSDSVCLGEPTTFIDASSILNSTLTTWGWNINNEQINGLNPTYTFNNDSSHNVTLIVASADGCLDTISKSSFVFPLPKASFIQSTNEIDFVLNKVSFRNTSSGGTIFNWSFGSFGTSSAPNPTYEYLINEPCQIWTNTLIIESSNGCKDSTTLNVTYKDNVISYAPNSFTPNGDLRNDAFKVEIFGVEKDSYEFTIFDRWGTIVFQTSDPLLPWDGRINGTLAPTGVYPWKIKSKSACSTDIQKLYGHVVLIK